MDPLNYYEILGVSPVADEVSIKRAFRRLSLELHPDKSRTESTKYSNVMKAYKILSDIQQRKLYDISLRNNNRNDCTNRQINSEQEQIDESKVAVIELNSKESRDNRFIRTSCVREEEGDSELEFTTIRKTVSINLSDCYQGATIPVRVNRSVNGNIEEALLYVNIPRGTDEGEVLECIGQGNIYGRTRADVRVKVEVEKHPNFTREGMNLVYRIQLSLKEAICGFSREIEHLDGKKYKVASEPGKIVQPGSIRIITGKGFIRNGCMRTGNLEIVFDVRLPEDLSASNLKHLQMILN